MKLHLSLLLAAILLLTIGACKEKEVQSEQGFSITTRIKRDPSFLFPAKSMASTETQINQYIYLPLANYDPYSLELIPVLLEVIPEGIKVKDGKLKGSIRFDCQFREEATWDNGSPITGHDYLFSVKTFKHQALKINPSVKSLFKNLYDVEVDEENPKKFSIYVDDFHLSKELCLVAEVLPEHIYDSLTLFRNYDLEDGTLSLLNPGNDALVDKISEQINFLNHADCGRKIIEGSGPYRLAEWQTNQFVRLEKKDNYWGEKIKHNPYLKAIPDQVIFSVFPDNTAAMTALQNGDIDVLGNMTGTEFKRIQENEQLKDRFDFFNPTQLKYIFLGINQESLILQDILVRKALAHLVDVNSFIENQELGYGSPIPGPILPAKEYFNDTLKLKEFDPEKAIEYLEFAGWEDADGDGIREKELDGQKKDLNVHIMISGNVLGKNLALILKERAKIAGMNIEIDTKDSKIIRQEIVKKNFDLYPTGVVYGPYPEDLYQSWHSDNAVPGGSNRYGFVNKEADRLIEGIRDSKNKEERNDLFRQFQELVYNEQVHVFLYVPTNNIIVNKEFKGKVSTKKPWYNLNHFELNN